MKIFNIIFDFINLFKVEIENLIKCFYFCIWIDVMFVVVIFLFSKIYRGREFCNRNLLGYLFYVLFIFGFDGLLYGFYYFFGWLNSYVEIFNKGILDVCNCIIILVWIYYEGNVGLIVNYKCNGWGVYFWMVNFRMLFVCYI